MKNFKQKQRLDQVVAAIYPQFSRMQIQSWIMQGKVTVDGKVVTKAGTPIAHDAQILVSAEKPKYVSRAGWKLEKALDVFAIDVTGLIALDAGLSTGGFTDCLLQRGITRVYGVDVGYGQVHEKIRKDPRVVVMERTNLRHLETLPYGAEVSESRTESVDIVTLDLSFISVLKVINVVARLLKPGGKLIVLIKPQFEAGPEDVGKGGIIRNPEIHQKVIYQVVQGIVDAGFVHQGTIESPILGTTGNKEFLAYFVKS